MGGNATKLVSRDRRHNFTQDVHHRPVNSLRRYDGQTDERRSHGGRVVASLDRSISILQRACPSGCCKAQHQINGGDGVLERELHGL
jgi:hypothetical protein